MGFVSEEWISPGASTGNYGVAEVTLVPSKPTSRFSTRHGLVMRLRAERMDSGEHQVIHFDSMDLLQFVACSVREVDPALRVEMLKTMLGEMSDDELLSSLDAEISRRREREAAG